MRQILRLATEEGEGKGLHAVAESVAGRVTPQGWAVRDLCCRRSQSFAKITAYGVAEWYQKSL
jgi:hypothetical protein